MHIISYDTFRIIATWGNLIELCRIWGFHGGDYEECSYLLTLVLSSRIFLPQKTAFFLIELFPLEPVTVAERSEACIVFARSEAGIVGSNPTQGMDVWWVCAFFCVCVVLCLGRGLATSWSPFQGVLPSVNDQETEKSALCSKKWEHALKWEAKRKKKNFHQTRVHSEFYIVTAEIACGNSLFLLKFSG
jgi:hypothetical protein